VLDGLVCAMLQKQMLSSSLSLLLLLLLCA